MLIFVYLDCIVLIFARLPWVLSALIHSWRSSSTKSVQSRSDLMLYDFAYLLVRLNGSGVWRSGGVAAWGSRWSRLGLCCFLSYFGEAIWIAEADLTKAGLILKGMSKDSDSESCRLLGSSEFSVPVISVFPKVFVNDFFRATKVSFGTSPFALPPQPLDQFVLGLRY